MIINYVLHPCKMKKKKKIFEFYLSQLMKLFAQKIEDAY